MLGIELSKLISIIIYVAGIGVVFLSIFYKTEIGLLFLVPLLPLQNVMEKIHKLPQGHSFVDFLIIALILGWLIQRSKGEKIFEKNSLNWPITLYIVITGISLLHGYFYLGTGLDLDIIDPRLSAWKNHMLLPILFFITFNNIKDLKWIKILVVAILLSIFLSDFFFYREFRWFKTWHYTHEMRIAGPFTYLGPNELGAFFVQYLMIVVGLLLFETRKVIRLLLIFLAAFSTYCLMYSFSRAGYLAFIIGMIFLLFIRSKILLLAFAVFILLSPLILPVSVVERIQMTTLSEEQKAEIEMSKSGKVGVYSEAEPRFDSSAQGRFDIWHTAMEMFKANPILGAGFRTFGYLQGIDTHNNYVKELAELGIAGFLIYIYLYYLAFKCGWQLYRKSEERLFKGLGLGFTACVIANIVVNLTHDNWSYINLMSFYWVLWALVVRGKIIIEQGLLKEGGVSAYD